MAERFTRVFSLPENLYTEGSPLLIAAGALLKDSMSGKLVAQLKLKAIGPRQIKAATVRLVPLDTADRPLGEAIRYSYLDLLAERDAEFGMENSIPLPNGETRGFQAAVTELIFADKSTWTAPETPWEPLPAPETPEHALGDAELVKQYRLRFGADAIRMPAEEKDLWFCACGAVNGQAEERCHRCGKARGELLPFDPEALKAARDQRLAQEREAQEAAEKMTSAKVKAKKAKKLLAITLPIVLLAVAALFVVTKVLIPNSRYQKALELAEAGQYEEAIAIFASLGDFKDAQEQSFTLWGQLTQRETISAGEAHTVGLLADGTVVATGYSENGMCDVSSWENVVAVSAGDSHTVGLLANGRVIATGRNSDGQCDVSNWKNVVAVSAGGYHTVGLLADGTVVATGYNSDGQCNVSGWENVVAVSAGYDCTVGLLTDGTVVTAGYNGYGQCDVSDWRNVAAVSSGDCHTVGLLADGTVVAAGRNDDGQCDVSGWQDVVAVSAGAFHTVGLLADGTVVATGWNDYGQCDVSGWTDVVAVSAGDYHTVGLRADGTVVATKYTGDQKYNYGQCDVGDWRDIKLPN